MMLHHVGYVWLSLLPIVAGCSLSAMKELSFSWPGFNNAMYSNIGMVMRNILSKKLMGGFKVCAAQSWIQSLNKYDMILLVLISWNGESNSSI